MSYAGTQHSMAPEVYEGLPYGLPVDIYSLGVIFYQLLTGMLPFISNNFDEYHPAHSMKPTFMNKQGCIAEVTDYTKEWISRMLLYEP